MRHCELQRTMSGGVLNPRTMPSCEMQVAKTQQVLTNALIVAINTPAVA